jgi:hypothetical protein
MALRQLEAALQRVERVAPLLRDHRRSGRKQAAPEVEAGDDQQRQADADGEVGEDDQDRINGQQGDREQQGAPDRAAAREDQPEHRRAPGHHHQALQHDGQRVLPVIIEDEPDNGLQVRARGRIAHREEVIDQQGRQEDERAGNRDQGRPMGPGQPHRVRPHLVLIEFRHAPAPLLRHSAARRGAASGACMATRSARHGRR